MDLLSEARRLAEIQIPAIPVTALGDPILLKLVLGSWPYRG